MTPLVTLLLSLTAQRICSGVRALHLGLSLDLVQNQFRAAEEFARAAEYAAELEIRLLELSKPRKT